MDNLTFTVVILKMVLLSLCLGDVCVWTSCEGWTSNGQTICDKYKIGNYSGYTNYLDCKWGQTSVKCCKPNDFMSDDEEELFGDPEKDCKFTEDCYGRLRGGDYACGYEFGWNWKPTGDYNQDNCKRRSFKRFKCCN